MLKNAIVVMFDSLQFNYLGCYGNTCLLYTSDAADE